MSRIGPAVIHKIGSWSHKLENASLRITKARSYSFRSQIVDENFFV